MYCDTTALLLSVSAYKEVCSLAYLDNLMIKYRYVYSSAYLMAYLDIL